MGQPEVVSLPVLIVIGIAGMLLLAIAIVLFFVIYQKRLLAQQGELLQLESDYQKGLLASSIETQEVERKRIASDLHDSVGSLLSATKLYLRKLNPEIETTDIGFLKKEALHLIEETIVNVRSITHDLSPQSLERFGLMAAVEDLVERLNEPGPLVLEFQYDENRRFDSKKEVALYRILQELLNNTLKHAEAKKVQIKFELQENQFHLLYTDDGKGFDRTQQKENGAKGLGLRSIESRVNFLNGELDMQSAPQQGLRVIIKIDTGPSL